MMLIDTDILIDFSKGIEFTKNFVYAAKTEGRVYIASVTELEFLQGSINKTELNRLKEICKLFSIKTPTNQAWIQAKQLIITYSLSHGMRYSDALIASTALSNGYKFCSINKKHFDFVKGLKLIDYKIPIK